MEMPRKKPNVFKVFRIGQLGDSPEIYFCHLDTKFFYTLPFIIGQLFKPFISECHFHF